MTSVPGKGMTVVEDGLVIQRVEPSHEGVYTCRASVAQTGEMEELHINLQVIHFVGQKNKLIERLDQSHL
jgi:hypothetical protein